MKKFFAICLLALTVTNTAFASDTTCDTLSAELAATKSAVIENAGNVIVPQMILGDARNNLNGLMDSLNSSGLSEESCPVSDLSAEIAQILQAVSNLESRNSQRLADASL